VARIKFQSSQGSRTDMPAAWRPRASSEPAVAQDITAQDVTAQVTTTQDLTAQPCGLGGTGDREQCRQRPSGMQDMNFCFSKEARSTP